METQATEERVTMRQLSCVDDSVWMLSACWNCLWKSFKLWSLNHWKSSSQARILTDVGVLIRNSSAGMDALQPLLGMPNNRLSVGWWSRGRVRNKKAIQFPHDDSHYTFYVSLRSDCPGQEKWPSTERRTFSATTQGIWGLLKGLPSQQEPKGARQNPTGTDFLKDFEGDIFSVQEHLICLWALMG